MRNFIEVRQQLASDLTCLPDLKHAESRADDAAQHKYDNKVKIIATNCK